MTATSAVVTGTGPIVVPPAASRGYAIVRQLPVLAASGSRRRSLGECETFVHLPPYMRRSKSIETLLPILYLKGISTGDISEAVGALRHRTIRSKGCLPLWYIKLHAVDR